MSTIGLSALPPAPAVDARLLEQLFDQVPDVAFFIKDARGRYLAVNHSLVERNGLGAKSDLIGRRPCEVCPGELGRAPAEQDAHVLRSARPIVERLEMHWRKPHRPCWCLTTKLPMRDSAGRITGLIGISRDVRAPDPLDDIPTGVSRALTWLEKNFAGQVSPTSLARRAGLSAPRFARIVCRIFNLTPTQLITKTRLAAASQSLRESNRSVAEIAVECGYYDHSAFTRAFKLATGVTPTEFRKTCG
jgi:PAS domain S-box-containing protein